MKKRYEDLAGKKFGKLTVREFSGRKGKDILWLCDCDCGNTKVAFASSLKAGNTTSCGCSKYADMIGKKFGRLTVVEKIGIAKGGAIYKCECECGGTINAVAKNLNYGSVTSCGCKNKERFADAKNREAYGWKDGTRKGTFEKETMWKTNTSGAKGVSWSKSNKGWIVRITYKGKVYHLGTFKENEFELAKGLRKEADHHVLAGDFENWIKEYKK